MTISKIILTLHKEEKSNVILLKINEHKKDYKEKLLNKYVLQINLLSFVMFF